ncbi:MAG: hypothetical protein ACSLFI_12855 [Solirubrobacterales bacterium]
MDASFVFHGRHADAVLAFRPGYEMGYIIGAIERRTGSLQELAPE